MTDKEVIIDGKKESVKVLFECKHIDDSVAYDMIRNGIKITPENAPIDDFELKLIENIDSPFGFSSICKRSSKEDVWEYMGFGHSGACSIVTALLKQLQRKEQEIEKIEKIIAPYQEPFELDALSLSTAIESILQRLQAENEELKEQLKKMEILDKKQEEKIYKQRDELNNFINETREITTKYHSYKQAIDEIEELINNFDDDLTLSQNQRIDEIITIIANAKYNYQC